MKLERIVVGVDGSGNADAAVRWAAGLAQATGAEVVAVHAVGLLERMPAAPEAEPGQPAIPGQGRDEARLRLESDWCRPLREAGIRWRALLRDGNPVTVLLATAEDEDADLVVVGSRGMGGFPELLLGSTSTQVAQHSPRPVTVVPAAPTAPAAAAAPASGPQQAPAQG